MSGGILPERVNMKEFERLHGILNKPAIKTIEVYPNLFGDNRTRLFAYWTDKDKGNWWIHFQGKNIGYWPSSLLPGIADGVDGAQYGGEVFESIGRSRGHTTTTEMGSGHFPGEGDNKAARFINVEVGNPLTYAYESPEKIGTFITSPGCYDLQTLENDQSGKYFFYGGPGKSKTCP
ncbi:hypothetical protein QJS04_geneDACA018108 [Acorus gramineus]|uniref:Neprosin PEP catalytic domain-containing protein n=1 Tax=Acorus gramineus TaxID=55184 RepID=A0AAV9AKE8_ACOGR|nr:hypothetical protein QJS04_geneDACA018108 [Acorus gramineus]